MFSRRPCESGELKWQRSRSLDNKAFAVQALAGTLGDEEALDDKATDALSDGRAPRRTRSATDALSDGHAQRRRRSATEQRTLSATEAFD